MTTTNIMPMVKFRGVDNAGTAAVGAKLFTYAAGTTTKQPTYTDSSGTTANTNPIILDARGECNIWGTPGILYDLVLAPSTDSDPPVNPFWAQEDITPIGDTSAVQAALASYIALVAGNTGAAQIGILRTISGAVVSTLQRWLDGSQFDALRDFGIIADGTTDNSPKITAAFIAAQGVPIRFPRQSNPYIARTTIDLTTTSSNVFTQGPQFFGDGEYVTIFDNQVANGPMIKLDTDTTLKFNAGAQFKGFGIITTTSPVNSIGIQLRRAFQGDLEHLSINGMSADGIKIIVNEGDGDGSNMIALRHIRVENCLGWGFNDAATAGHNELSFLTLDNVFIQSCGTASGAYPPTSGGMIWRGQILNIPVAAFVLNQNVGLFIQGESGLGNSFSFGTLTMENNIGRSILCTGIDNMNGDVIQLYNNDNFRGTVQFELDASAFEIRNVEIRSAYVRASSGNNPITTFKLSGANAIKDSIRIGPVTWSDFDHTGQTRFNGFQFDAIEKQCDISILSTTSGVLVPTGRGNKMPMKLGSSTGEWVQTEISSGGLGFSNSGLAISTRYYVYLYDNSGSQGIELSTTVPAVDANSGYMVKTGNSTRLYLGSVITDGAGLFAVSATGWLNPTLISGSQVGVPAYAWRDSTGNFRLSASAPLSDTGGTLIGP